MSKTTPWTSEEIEALREIYALDIPKTRRVVLYHERLPHRTLNAIHNQAKALGITHSIEQCPWTDEERATLREVYYAVLPPGQFRKPELLRRLPGRTYNAIRHQILTLGLTHPEAQKWRRVRDPGLAGKIYEALTRHGPISSAELTELLGLDLRRVTNAVGHLVRRSALVKEGSRPHRWRINTTPPGPVRRVPRGHKKTGVTPEDMAWMRRYREQRLARLRRATSGEVPCRS